MSVMPKGAAMESMSAGEVEVASKAITSIANLFTRAISAYENCKRIDFEMAELHTKRNLALKAFELKELELRGEKQKFDRICKQLDEQLSAFKVGRKDYLNRQKHFQRQSDRILDKILKFRGGGDDSQLEVLIRLWERAESEIERAARDENNVVLNFPNSAKHLLETHNARIGCSSRPQIGL